MLEKIYLHLLILCGILCHGIIAKLSNEDTRESSNLLVREKRVINHLPNGLIPTRIELANYMLNIKQSNRLHCAGAILTHYIGITSALCLSRPLTHYRVLSGSGDDRYANSHVISSLRTHYGSLPHEEFDGIALITVDPPFVFGPRTGNIRLHEGPLLTGAIGTVTGWGCTYPAHPIPGISKRLRSITLPIINHEECQNIYRGRFNITEKHLCTYDENKHCANRDAGTPLVLEDRMVGIHVWKGEYRLLKNPDVFINLQSADYSQWIRQHTT